MNRIVKLSVAMAAVAGLSWMLVGVARSRQVKSEPASALALQTCNLSGVSGPARCGTFEVFEDRAAKSGRKIKLHIVVLPALGPAPAPDPVFVFQGGPGGAASDLAADASSSYLREVRDHHDLVFVDQRGTGQSNPLNCDVGDDPEDLQSFFGELLPPEKIRACRQKLEKVADLRMYTTPIAMDDLDDVRTALGYNKINLAGASYGTIAAQAYMRQHPDHVRAVLLAGVATPAIKQPLLFARAAQHALDLLFEDCAADSACHAAYPNLQEEFRQVLARFDKGPLEVEFKHPSTQKNQRILLARGNFVERIRLLLYSTSSAAYVPFILHRFYQNDYLTFETAAIISNVGGEIARGMYFTVTCSEGVPFISDQELARETQNTFVGDYRVRVHREACKLWPRGAVEAAFIEPVKSLAPVLMISGEADGSTPPWYGEAAMKYLPNGRQLKIRYYGHQMDEQCVWNIISPFLEKGTTEGLDTSCTAAIRRPPFAHQLPALQGD
ncbi:MAG TPA: alpha/beta hydrolase [Candidatus Angelobacter sp.]